MEASAAQPSRLKPVVATLVGIPAVAIVLAAANGAGAPLVGDGTVMGLKWLIAWLSYLPRGMAAA